MKLSSNIIFIKLCFSIFVMTILKFSTGQNIVYDDAMFGPDILIDRETPESIHLTYSIHNFSLSNVMVDGQEMKQVHLPKMMLPNNEGAPNLPGVSKFIAIPRGAVPTFKIIYSRTDTLKNYLIAPAPEIPLDTAGYNPVLLKDAKIYAENTFYPARQVQLSELKKIRGVDVVMVGVSPFRYNPVTKELLVHRDIKIQVRYHGGNGQYGDMRLRSRWFDPILKDALLNAHLLPPITTQKIAPPKERSGYEYIIIVPDDADFIKWADSLKLFRNMQGIKTGVVTTADIGGNTVSDIEGYINNAYNNWSIPPVAVLLLGDHGSSGNRVISPSYNNFASDNIYADVDGDNLPDMAIARMTAQNSAHVETMVTKVLKYERDPPSNSGFYNNPVTALGWQTERWFQICAETVGGFWSNELNKNPVRINKVYSGTPGTIWSTAQNTSTVVNYFGPNGLGYIPATPNQLGGWTGGNATQINNAINSGAFMLLHRDHGGTTGWGEPDYNNSDINNLHNTDLCFVFSINCLTGKFNISGECFAEKFHRHTHNGQPGGALGVIAASAVSYSFVNDTYVWGMTDAMWPDFDPGYGATNECDIRPCFANLSGKYYLEASNWPYNTNSKTITYHLFHHHGDAFTTVYSEVPQGLTVIHNVTTPGGQDYITVQANPYALIALSVNGEIIGTGEGTGSPVDISFLPQQENTTIDIVVTKQNYYRYHGQAQVYPTNLNLQNITVGIGQTVSYEASNSITAAGGGAYFIVDGNGSNGGNVTFTTENYIKLKSGFHAKPGSFFHAYNAECKNGQLLKSSDKEPENIPATLENNKITNETGGRSKNAEIQ